ncbi:hypothetical protein BC939DRAFT_453260 [Gamsiella multidivaricata]|uniref:uncharacterized protein n=1 Tax=Gamsiella multidivaricata TaxID=101098 RepID=UPI0022201C55|nr:uncharacterized protein BC939DRAFT_453260 [Gamsiella multidivaricata]KAI7822665.1 hypothetical protein BC939DRAFT_453260 [Gamsiella multidivaricata]
MANLKLFCIIDGESIAFTVKIAASDTVDDFKKLIKAQKASPSTTLRPASSRSGLSRSPLMLRRFPSGSTP